MQEAISFPGSRIRTLVSDGIHLRRIFHVPIFIDLSWILIFVFVAYLNSNFFAQFHRQWGTAQYWIAAALTSLLFFVCVLLHELAHSLVAQHYDVPVLSITMFVFGGLAQISREPPKAMQEFNIAMAGPLASALLGLIFYFPILIVPKNEFANVLLTYLSGANFSLALFNLLPGIPLDGGRVLRAIVWGATKDFKRATRAARTSGKLVGFSMMSLGFSGVGVGPGRGLGDTGLVFAGSLLMMWALGNEGPPLSD
jgi:Zn-dependent protease